MMHTLCCAIRGLLPERNFLRCENFLSRRLSTLRILQRKDNPPRYRSQLLRLFHHAEDIAAHRFSGVLRALCSAAHLVPPPEEFGDSRGREQPGGRAAGWNTA